MHLFFVGPAGLAVEIGRGVNARIWPEVCLYEYSMKQNPRYQHAFSLM
ncbi:SAVED domain-containing protein [Brevibacillus laterosporus]